LTEQDKPAGGRGRGGLLGLEGFGESGVGHIQKGINSKRNSVILGFGTRGHPRINSKTRLDGNQKKSVGVKRDNERLKSTSDRVRTAKF